MKADQNAGIGNSSSTSIEAYMTAARDRADVTVDKACKEFAARGYDDPELMGYVETYFGPIRTEVSPTPKINPNFPNPR